LQNIFVRGCGDRWESLWLGECGDAAPGRFSVCVCAGRAGIEEEEEDNSNHTSHFVSKVSPKVGRYTEFLMPMQETGVFSAGLIV